MAVGFCVHYFWYQVGSGEFLHAFFSTIAYHLENGKWGSRYPVLMRKLYQGELKSKDINLAIKELEEIRSLLQCIPPEKVVWDIEDLSKQPPWGDNISEEITDLSNYFVTSGGEDLIITLRHALDEAKELKVPLKIDTL